VAQADVGFRRRSELAKTRLTALPAQELLERQKMFVTSRGGSWKAVQQEKEKQKKGSTLEKTRELLKEGLSLEKVAKKRKFALSTVVGHAEKLLEQGDEFDFSSYTPSPNILSLVKAAVAEHGFEKLSPVKRYLEEAGHRISYDQLRRIRLSVLSQTKPKKKEES
ncbi:MAG: helix-turn-helix domain-containing protein, partial [bacterium]|nr:helix-turn-helix domain-containing protein [bacterium]